MCKKTQVRNTYETCAPEKPPHNSISFPRPLSKYQKSVVTVSQEIQNNRIRPCYISLALRSVIVLSDYQISVSYSAAYLRKNYYVAPESDLLTHLNNCIFAPKIDLIHVYRCSSL